jgi:outer membrane lipoprotein LolB
MSSVFRCCAALCVALLAACAGVAPQHAIESVPPFELAGRIAVRYQEHAFASSLRWTQAAGRDDIWLTAPLGQTIAHLEADAQGATLTGADQRQYRAGSIESLTYSALGWRFPVAGMRFWVFGEAAPGTPPAAVERDDTRRLTRFTQYDWQVAFTYATLDAARPSRIDLAGSDAQIRLVIDNLTRNAP